MFLTTCTLLPPTFIQPHTRNHSLTRLGLYILTDTQHQIILLFTSPTRLRTDTQAEQGAEPSSSLSSHTQGPGEREQRRAARALSQGLLLGLGSRPIRARVTRVRVTRVRATRVRVNRARVRFWHGVRVRVRVMARVSHAHSAHNPSNPS